mmetsp:Transcript_16279/g.18330  ORF Transcript_16279/g.18330 Transcript_16279/m.18330 type:complete len:109 (+) Transcript_16279:151-477(+)
MVIKTDDTLNASTLVSFSGARTSLVPNDFRSQIGENGETNCGLLRLFLTVLQNPNYGIHPDPYDCTSILLLMSWNFAVGSKEYLQNFSGSSLKFEKLLRINLEPTSDC